MTSFILLATSFLSISSASAVYSHTSLALMWFRCHIQKVASKTKTMELLSSSILGLVELQDMCAHPCGLPLLSCPSPLPLPPPLLSLLSLLLSLTGQAAPELSSRSCVSRQERREALACLVSPRPLPYLNVYRNTHSTAGAAVVRDRLFHFTRVTRGVTSLNLDFVICHIWVFHKTKLSEIKKREVRWP